VAVIKDELVVEKAVSLQGYIFWLGGLDI